MSNVIPLHQTKQAKAKGVFAQINIAARALGYSDQFALRAAQRARDAYLQGGKSPARVVSDSRAELRLSVEGMQA